jgi:hypothetical protein
LYFEITSAKTDEYNCIAWAAGEAHRWWWPGHGRYWPPAAPYDETLRAFIIAFMGLGYEPCDAEDFEEGFDKVALFADETPLVTHMARQLPNGRWTSKLGSLEDVEHDLRAVESADYGQVAQILKRRSRVAS